MDGSQTSSGSVLLVEALTPELLSDLMQRVGYRVQAQPGDNGAIRLHSATGGVSFQVVFSNPVSGQMERFLDARFVAAIRIEGDLAPTIINGWNASMRFARLYTTEGFLVLDMDVSAISGISEGHVMAAVQVWDRLLQGLIAYLRDVLAPRQSTASRDNDLAQTGEKHLATA